jgi:hypothetical protein
LAEWSIKNIFSRKVLVPVVIVFAVAWLAGCGTIYWKMSQPPETFARFMARLPGPVAFLAFPFESMWMRARAGHLQVGDAAPDFSLSKLDKSGTVELAASAAKQRPVVLIFGSYT